MVRPGRRRHGAAVIVVIRDGYGAAVPWPSLGRYRHIRTGMSLFSRMWRVTPPRISCRSREWL